MVKKKSKKISCKKTVRKGRLIRFASFNDFFEGGKISTEQEQEQEKEEGITVSYTGMDSPLLLCNLQGPFSYCEHP